MTIDAVVFDVGNVLIEWNPERFYNQIIGEDRRRAMFAAADLFEMNEQVDRGADFRDTVYAMAEACPEFRNEIRLWHDRWIELAQPDIPQSVRLLQALRARGIPVFALTNFGVGTWTIAAKAYGFLGSFDRHFISGHLGVIKPEARIYEMVEEQSGLPPKGLLFTDDRIDNIEAAAERGWQVHHFDGPQGWADRLVAEGLLTAKDAQ